jgi:hypothetical protein
MSLGIIFVSAVPAFAGMVGSPRQLPAGSLKIFAYYEGVQGQDLDFALSSEGQCTTNNGTSPNAGFACGSTGHVSAEGSGGSGKVRVLYQPYESVQYRLGAGVGDYSLKVASITQANTLNGGSPGTSLDAGLKFVLWPDTLVGPGLAADLGMEWDSYRFTSFPQARTAAEGAIDQRLDLLRTQVSLQTGHVFKPESWRVGVEPYGGVQWIRTQAWLKDYKGGGCVGGIQDTVAPFLGVHLAVYENEGLFVEASVVNGWRYAAGLNVRFK